MIKIFRWFFRLTGWKMAPNTPPEAYRQSVMLAAPHTTQWDAMYMIGAFGEMGIPLRYAIKKEFKRIPIIGSILASVGALWIDRSSSAKDQKRRSYIDVMAEFFETGEDLAMIIAPEGTRSLQKEWKLGFYHIAVKAGVPITLGYLDYPTKTAGVGGPIFPSGDMEEDLKKIMDFYRDIRGKHPQKFMVDQRYDRKKTPPAAEEAA
ncbi:MAG: 1-acyl-sn-glycerol-3-phosphate acyltransferase [Bacteroidota bacterium]